MQRLDWVDNAKAYAIFLVVWGHMADLDPLIKGTVYAFNLPIFLIVTGFLNVSHLQKAHVGGFLKSYVFPYIRVYAAFSIAASIIWYVLEQRHAPLSVIWQPIAGSAYGVHGKDFLLVHNDDPLWYWPFLITTLIISYALFYVPVAFRAALIAIYLAFSLYYTGPRLPWGLDTAGVGVLLVHLGGLLRDHIRSYEQLAGKKDLWALPLLLLAVAALYLLNGRTNLNFADFGVYPPVSIINSLLGCAMLMILSRHVKVTRAARLLSQHTLIIFCTHIYLVKIASKALPLPANWIAAQLMILATAIAITAICAIVSVLVTPLFNRLILLKPARAKER